MGLRKCSGVLSSGTSPYLFNRPFTHTGDLLPDCQQAPVFPSMQPPPPQHAPSSVEGPADSGLLNTDYALALGVTEGNFKVKQMPGTNQSNPKLWVWGPEKRDFFEKGFFQVTLVCSRSC